MECGAPAHLGPFHRLLKSRWGRALWSLPEQGAAAWPRQRWWLLGNAPPRTPPRRFEAHQRLGLPTIRCRVRKASREILRMHMM